MNSHLRNAFADWFTITKVTAFSTVYSHLYAPHGLLIFQGIEPIIKNVSCLD